MKKIIVVALMVVGAMSASAQNVAKNDTVAVSEAKIQKVIRDESVNSKGRKTTKYYFMYDKKLIPTSKTVVEEYNLCKKHGAECALAIVINRKTNRKRVVINN